MSDGSKSTSQGRRNLLKGVAGGTALFAGFGVNPIVAGAYPNFMMDDEGEARVRAAYGPNYERLAAAKKRYDPTNLFRVNQNIQPAA